MLKTKNKHLRYVITFFAVLCSSLLQTFVIESFVHSAGLLSGGFTGVAILIDRAASLYGGSISTSLALVALNLPVAVLCYRSISPRFTLFSLLQVGMTSLFLKYFSLPPIFDDILLSAVFGGFLMGISIVLALKGNASTGGTDFIALYVSNKTGKSIWSYVFVFNACILCIFGYLFGWLYAGYSILFQFISTKTVETLRTADASDHHPKGRGDHGGLCERVPARDVLREGGGRIQPQGYERPAHRDLQL